MKLFQHRHSIRIAAWSAGCALSLAAGLACAGDLRVTITGVESPKGDVLVGLYDNEAAFPNGTRVSGQKVAAAAAQQGEVHVEFKDLPPGRYALVAYQDLNGRGRLETNMMGMPLVPYGASRGARNRFGPPRFEDAAFVMGNGNEEQSFNIR